MFENRNDILMERKERTVMISLRVPEGLLSRIENDVEQNGDHASRADWIIAAIRSYETERAKLIAIRKAADAEASRTSIATGAGSDSCSSPSDHAN